MIDSPMELGSSCIFGLADPATGDPETVLDGPSVVDHVQRELLHELSQSLESRVQDRD